MNAVKRTRLEWARDVARHYRRALLKADPTACAHIDEQARAAGQQWVAPESVPVEVAEAALTAVMAPPEIARVSGIPVGTIYSWVSRGLLQPVEPVRSGTVAKYLVKDVLELEARRRVRRLDTA